MLYQTRTLLGPRTTPAVVDDDEGIPSQLIEDLHYTAESGPLGPATDPRTAYLSSMSEHDKTQSYDVYDYQQAARPEQASGQDYTSFTAAHPHYTHDFVVTQAQASTNLAHTSALPFLAAGPSFPVPHDQYFAASQTQFPTAALPSAPQQSATASTATSTVAFPETGPRQLPEVISYSPSSGSPGIKLAVHIQTQYDLAYPQASISIMLGHKRCDSVVSRISPGSPHQYVIATTVPPATGPSQVSVQLAFEGPVTWQTPTLDVGSFTYTNAYTSAYPLDSPPASRKRKLSDDTGRHSPTKKSSYQDVDRGPSFYPAEASSFARTQGYPLSRRVSQPGYTYELGLPRVQSQQYYQAQPASASARLQGEAPSGYEYFPTSGSNLSASTRDQATIVPAARSAHLHSASASGNPPLIRTSTLHQSPTMPGLPVATTQGFNPYAMYPANTKAMLKIDGDLNSMVETWTPAEWEAKRRLVQFQRSQSGSIITTTFEPVTLEERAPNSICVSCIWWTEKQECYVTSVDTIQLLESLVAVRFTVEEKNRIRRNLEGFRPATVSKTKADSEDFFKLIMGFPNPKPRNIEKDVKVFPWRILSTALKKIIGKYSASYSSTAGALHTPSASSYAARMAEGAMDQRVLASPRSTSSSATSHGHTYATAMTSSQSYLPHPTAPTIDMSAGRLSVPHSSSLYGSSAHHYGSAHADMSTASSSGRTPSWDYASGLHNYNMTPAMPVSAAQWPPYTTTSLLTHSNAQQTPSEQRFVPLHDYEQQGQPTTSGA